MSSFLTPSRKEENPPEEIPMPRFIPEAFQPKPLFRLSDLMAPKEEPKISDLIKGIFEVRQSK